MLLIMILKNLLITMVMMIDILIEGPAASRCLCTFISSSGKGIIYIYIYIYKTEISVEIPLNLVSIKLSTTQQLYLFGQQINIVYYQLLYFLPTFI
jgi:hypothetical protein